MRGTDSFADTATASTAAALMTNPGAKIPVPADASAATEIQSRRPDGGAASSAFAPEALESLAEARGRRVAVFLSTEYEGLYRNGGIGTYYREISEVFRAAGWFTILFNLGPKPEGAADAFPGLDRVFHAGEAGLFMRAGRTCQAMLDSHHGSYSVTMGLQSLFFLEALVSALPGQDIYAEFAEMGGFACESLKAKESGWLDPAVRIGVTMHSGHEFIYEANGALLTMDHLFISEIASREEESFRKADVPLYPSESLHAIVRTYGWRTDRAVRLPYFVPLHPGAPSEAETSGEVEIIFFGRLEERKGLLEFLDALELLAQTPVPRPVVAFLGKDVRLYSAATGRVMSSEFITERMERIGFQFRILPDLNSEEAVALVRSRRGSCVVCLASANDNFPNAALELGQVPVPLVVSDTPGFHDTLGLLGRTEGIHWFEPRSARSLAGKLAQAVAAADSPTAAPDRESVQAINEHLAARRFALVDEAFAATARAGEPRAPEAEAWVLADGNVDTAMATLGSLERAAQEFAATFLWSPSPWSAAEEARLRGTFPRVSLTRALPAPGSPRLILVARAGAVLEPQSPAEFLRAATRSGAALVTGSEWDPAGPTVRMFSPPSVSRILRGADCAGSVIAVSSGFLAELPPLGTTDAVDIIRKLTLGAAATGAKTAFIPYPRYTAAATPDEAPGRGSDQVGLSRYAACIPASRWQNRELFGLSLGLQQLGGSVTTATLQSQAACREAEALRRELAAVGTDLASAREELGRTADELETVRAVAREKTNELAAVYRSKSWRSTAPLRIVYKLLTAISRLPPSPPSARGAGTSLPTAPLGEFPVADMFPSLEDEIGPWRSLLKGRVLNAGAGNRDLSPLVEGELTNQDITEGLHNAGIHVHSPLHRIPREDGHFDVIFCNAVLEHAANPEEVLAEFARVCRPGGHLYLCIPFLQPEHKDPTDYQRYTADGLAALVARHGFQPVAVEPMHSIYTTLSWIVVTWLSFSDCRRNRVLRRLLYPVLRNLCRTSKEVVPAAASAYRVIAIRGEDAAPAGAPPRADVAVVMALRSVVPFYKGPLSIETPLGTAGIGLDSIGHLELILAVEKTAGVKLKKSELNAESLATVGSLAAVVDNARHG